MVNAELKRRVDDGPARESCSFVNDRRWLLIGVAALLLAASTACTSQSPGSASPSVSAATTTAEGQETPEEAAKSAALDAFTELLHVRDAAAQDPGAQDWEPEIRKHAADPAAYAAVQSVRTYATLGVHQVGDSKVELQVTGVDLHAAAGPTVSISATDNLWSVITSPNAMEGVSCTSPVVKVSAVPLHVSQA